MKDNTLAIFKQTLGIGKGAKVTERKILQVIVPGILLIIAYLKIGDSMQEIPQVP